LPSQPRTERCTPFETGDAAPFYTYEGGSDTKHKADLRLSAEDHVDSEYTLLPYG
jgi:hypothetical protein